MIPSSITLASQSIPVKVIRERRTSFRAATGKEGFILRLPKRLPKSEEKRAWDWFETWAKDLHRSKPEFLQRFVSKSYADGDTVQVGTRLYTLGVTLSDRASHAAKLLPNRYIQMDLVAAVSAEERNKAAATLLSRLIAQDFLPEFSRRVLELNQLHFRKSIKNIRFKNTSSRWGSCSNTGNLNFSTRLLFAPQEVIDYVIIHELAHLIELNHSDRFWDLVEKAMPDYAEQEKWLKKNGGGLGF